MLDRTAAEVTHDTTRATDALEIIDSPVRRGAHAVRMIRNATDLQVTSGTRVELQNGSLY